MSTRLKHTLKKRQQQHTQKEQQQQKRFIMNAARVKNTWLYMSIYNKIKSQWQFNSSSNEEQCSWLLMYATADLTAGEKEHDL